MPRLIDMLPARGLKKTRRMAAFSLLQMALLHVMQDLLQLGTNALQASGVAVPLDGFLQYGVRGYTGTIPSPETK